MTPPSLQSALALLFTLAPDSPPELAVRRRWRSGAQAGRSLAGEQGVLAVGLRDAADALGAAITALTSTPEGVSELGHLLTEPGSEPLFAWYAESAGRRDLCVADVLHAAERGWRGRAGGTLGSRLAAVARARVLEGPLRDALACAPLLGDGVALASVESAEARARLEILIWEAGASALEVPALGPWVWGETSTFDELVTRPAHGSLRGRVLAARCLEISAAAMPATAAPELIGRTLQVLQPLLLHPEPLVWVHAARALGRLTGEVQQLEGTLLDWVLGERKTLRQRAITAFASLPAKRLKYLGSHLAPFIDSTSEDPWVLASVAAASPHLFFGRRDLFDRLVSRVLDGAVDGADAADRTVAGATAAAARALAVGLASLYRRGERSASVEAPMRALRDRARTMSLAALDEARGWLDVIASTDPLDLAERDPLDLETAFDNLVRVAAQYDDEEADARAGRLVASFDRTFLEARRVAVESPRPRHRAAALNALESSARVFALRLWGPLVATHPGRSAEQGTIDLSAATKLVAATPAELLDLVTERRQARRAGARAEGSGGTQHDGEADLDVQLETLALKLQGYVLDASGELSAGHAGRGPAAHATCLLTRKLEGLTDGSREFPPTLLAELSALLWRIVDATRGTALGEVEDIEWLGPFAAWWGLVIDRPSVLLQLATALPMMNREALELCCKHAEQLRMAVAAGAPGGTWGEEAAGAFEALHAGETRLGMTLLGFADALSEFESTASHRPNFALQCAALVTAAEQLRTALEDPVKGLRSPRPSDDPDDPDDLEDALGPTSLSSDQLDRTAALVQRAIQGRQMSMLTVWFASLGPVMAGLLETAVGAAMQRSPPPPPRARKAEPEVVEGYELVKPLGQGGLGTVWLVRKRDADRLFVLKIPKAEALAGANEMEREGILSSFVEEARALANLYHPNVANIIDRGVTRGMPFLVLEYLIGADLKEYSTARLMTLSELRPVVDNVCSGLAALHSADLVHRDLKPANLWLRLPLASGERFDAKRHRDPAQTPPLNSVIIDFGLVRARRIAPEAAGRLAAGTAGYVAPEQVLDPAELDPRADVYSLAATLYNVLTGRAFFDELSNDRDRLIAHIRQNPFDDAERLRPFSQGMSRLLRAATARAAADRPSPQQFAREFAACV